MTMTNSQDDRPDDADDPWAPDELERMIDNVQTADDFIEFVNALAEEVWQDEELRERVTVEFLRVMSSRLRFWKSIQTPELVRVPEQPDWSWLAEILHIAAFEN